MPEKHSVVVEPFDRFHERPDAESVLAEYVRGLRGFAESLEPPAKGDALELLASIATNARAYEELHEDARGGVVEAAGNLADELRAEARESVGGQGGADTKRPGRVIEIETKRPGVSS